MKKKKSKPNSVQPQAASRDIVLITGTAPPAIGTIEAQMKIPDASLTRPLAELQQEWTIINEQVIVLLDQTEKRTTKTGFELNEVSFKLGINAKGHIGLLASVEAGGEASITLTFKRKP
jgi:hypothetical protein